MDGKPYLYRTNLAFNPSLEHAQFSLGYLILFYFQPEKRD